MPISPLRTAIAIGCLFAAMLLWRVATVRTERRIARRRMDFDERAGAAMRDGEHQFRLGRLSLVNPPDDAQR